MSYEIEERPNYLFVRVFDKLTGDELRRISMDIAKLEETRAVAKHRIADMSPLESIDLCFEQVELLAQTRREAKLVQPIRSAIIAPRPIHYGFARMFEMLNDNPMIQMRVVTTIDEALLWIGES
jgi:hypothetical protein